MDIHLTQGQVCILLVDGGDLALRQLDGEGHAHFYLIFCCNPKRKSLE